MPSTIGSSTTSPDMLETTLADLATNSRRLAEEVEARDAVVDRAVNAKADVLARAIDLARPVLDRITGAIDRQWLGCTTDGRHGVERGVPFPRHGLVLTGTLYERVGGYDDTRGAVTGRALVLWADGTLSTMRTKGTWTRWADERPWEKRAERPITTQQAMAAWELEPCLTALATAIREALDPHLATRLHTAEDRVARLQAALDSLVR